MGERYAGWYDPPRFAFPPDWNPFAEETAMHENDPAGTPLERIKAAITAHEPENGSVQWYVDDLTIDCDAEEFWRVAGKTLASHDLAEDPR